MNQTTTAATSTIHPVDLEALRLQLEEDGRFYKDDQRSEQARERLLHTLQKNDCREIITAVVDGCDLASAFVVAGHGNHVDILEAFLNHGMTVDVKDENGYTALMFASCSGEEECVRFLLDRNASVDVQDRTGFSALMWASQGGVAEIVEILLEKNANCDMQSDMGMTALMFASLRGHKDVVQLLLNHNANIGLKNSDGETALDLADDEETKEMIRNHVTASYVLK